MEGQAKTCQRSTVVDVAAHLTDFNVNQNAWISSMLLYRLGFFGIDWDHTPFLDNKASFQRGVNQAVRRTSVELVDALGRMRGTSSINNNLQDARGNIQFDEFSWYFGLQPFGPKTPTPSYYRAAIKSLRAFNGELASCAAIFDGRADNLLEFVDRIANDLGNPASILRDRSARRLDQTVTASGLMRRYNADRKTVLKALTRLTDENLLDRAPGQSWLFRRAPDDPEAQGESYEFRLLLEPAALLAPGFRLDGARAAALRQGMEALAALPDPAFDTREFQRLDIEFHGMIADGSANRFITDALSDHLRLRRLPGIYAGINVFRLKQSLREHLTILDHLESRQYEVAADLLRVHLRLSRSQRPQAASRGAPALFGMISRPD